MIRAFLLAAVLALVGCATMQPPSAMAFHIEMTHGSCSATAVGPHTLLTASHCFEGGNALVRVDGKDIRPLAYVSDGFDHTLVTVDETFAAYADIGRSPARGVHVSYYGNPGPFLKLYRDGRVYGDTTLGGKNVTLYGLNGFPGDSGSGLFDDQGRLVAVISFVFMMDDGPRWQAMGSYPLHFTPEQWAKVRA